MTFTLAISTLCITIIISRVVCVIGSRAVGNSSVLQETEQDTRGHSEAWAGDLYRYRRRRGDSCRQSEQRRSEKRRSRAGKLRPTLSMSSSSRPHPLLVRVSTPISTLSLRRVPSTHHMSSTRWSPRPLWLIATVLVHCPLTDAALVDVLCLHWDQRNEADREDFARFAGYD